MDVLRVQEDCPADPVSDCDPVVIELLPDDDGHSACSESWISDGLTILPHFPQEFERLEPRSSQTSTTPPLGAKTGAFHYEHVNHDALCRSPSEGNVAKAHAAVSVHSRSESIPAHHSPAVGTAVWRRIPNPRALVVTDVPELTGPFLGAVSYTHLTLPTNREV